jgi:hypothetical protein
MRYSEADANGKYLNLRDTDWSVRYGEDFDLYLVYAAVILVPVVDDEETILKMQRDIQAALDKAEAAGK